MKSNIMHPSNYVKHKSGISTLTGLPEQSSAPLSGVQNGLCRVAATGLGGPIFGVPVVA